MSRSAAPEPGSRSRRNEVREFRPVTAAAFLQAIVVVAVAAAVGSGGVWHVLAALVLAPAGVFATAAVARRTRRGLFPVLAAFVHVLLPLAAIPYFFHGYRRTYVHGALPWLLGLRAPTWLLLGVGLALAAAFAPRTVLAAAGLGAWIAGPVVWGFSHADSVRLGGIHETAWSLGTLEWLLAAGLLGMLLRSPRLGVAVGGCFWLFMLRATYEPYGTGGFWRALAAGLPAAALLLSSIALLVPPLPRVRPALRTLPARLHLRA